MHPPSQKARLSPSLIARNSLSVALAFCLLGPPLPVFAAETDEAALGRAETILFGDQVQGGDINDRLVRVEKRIFGRRKNGTDEERVERITSTLLIDRKKLKVTKKPEETAKKAEESEMKAEKPAESVTEKQAENQSEKQPEVQAERPAENPTEKTTEKAAESSPEKQPESQPEKQVEKQVEKQAESLPEKPAEPVAQTQPEPPALKAQQPVADKPVAPKGKGKIAAKRGKRNGGKSENKTSPVAAKKPEITLTPETAALDSRKVEKHHSALDTPVSYTSSSPNRISRGASPKVHQAATLLKEGMEAHRRGEDAKAEQLFKKVVLLEPRNPDGYFNLGALAEKKKDLAGALMSYRAALNLSPNDRELRDAVDSVESMLGVETADGHRVAGGSNSRSGDVEHDQLRTSETKNPEARSAEIREFYAKESVARERAAMESSDRFESAPGAYGFGHNGHKSHSANIGPATAPNFYRARAKTTRELQEEAAPYANVNEPYAPELSVSPPPTPVVNAGQPQPFQLQTQRSQANMQANQPKRPSAAGAATRAILGVALSVGTSYALRSSGLHCPVCRIGGGGGALRGLLRF